MTRGSNHQLLSNRDVDSSGGGGGVQGVYVYAQDWHPKRERWPAWTELRELQVLNDIDSEGLRGIVVVLHNVHYIICVYTPI